jgi:hypothetical protein
MKSGYYMTGSSSFINTTCNFFPLCAGGQVSYPHKVTGKITVLYISVFMFLCMIQEDKDSEPKYSQNFPLLVNRKMVLLLEIQLYLIQLLL